MRGDIGRWRALANAGFAVAVLALAGFGLYQVAGRQWRVQPTFHVRAQFESIAGLEVGHRVRVQGIDAGVVERIVAPAEPGQPVELVLRVDERLRRLVRTDAVARIASEGLVGSKAVEVTPGRPDAPALAELGTIASERPDRNERSAQEGRFHTGPARLRHADRRARARRVERDRGLRFAAAKAAWASWFTMMRPITTSSTSPIAASEA